MVNGTGRSRFGLPKLVASVISLVGLIALGNCPVHAQGFSAAITGTVKDTSGAAVPGATVTVRHLETGLTRQRAPRRGPGGGRWLRRFRGCRR